MMLAAMIAGDSAAAMLATRQHIEAGWLELRASVATNGEVPNPMKPTLFLVMDMMNDIVAEDGFNARPMACR